MKHCPESSGIPCVTKVKFLILRGRHSWMWESSEVVILDPTGENTFEEKALPSTPDHGPRCGERGGGRSG